MAKKVEDVLMDNGLQHLVDNGENMTLCNAQPTTYTEAITTFKLADVVMVPGDFSLAAGSPSGRECNIAAKAAVAVDTNGTGDHVAISDTAGTALLIVTTLSASKVVTTDDTVSFPAWIWTILAAT